ncbi:TrmB family transcriptional regulator [Candidatus Woesearchaeota archaeon]|jgi:HTH-type transcriptional regulator, sugar sensing transcriptional regulator|nr:TrmB family transcriptional regulator [Candidatus Woesearchaeota archaeon]MBT4387946.1 TrmB family transcriptional regulator [Candidatus Woesearchaeota archaeon]MBT4595764.1 TrmB family transcriptional regulator [Candidatus Woesearchaeota archaeon]MBT5741387.1 TrmB family transcriptional regulator [Candidatus Woesearchaeota archaeon]MBT6505209.1 TrmB family transcriptional regulator [Candidatus Woesearchaeota archaeon]
MDFEELGLSYNESRVFTRLTELGKSSASKIAAESGVPYGKIYTVLASLEHKGFVKVIPGKSKSYVINNPDRLKKIIDEKKEKIDSIEKEIDRLKTIYDTQEREPVTIHHGKKGWNTIISSVEKATKSDYCIKYHFSLDPKIIQGAMRIRKEKIKSKCMGQITEENKSNIKGWIKLKDKMKQIPNDGIALEIVDENRMWITLIKSNMTLIIRDKPFVKLFSFLYNYYYDSQELINIQDLKNIN